MNRQLDPGLQPQRTALAWSRTALAMLVNALLVLRAGMQEHDPAVLALACLLGLLAAGLWGMGSWRRTALRRAQFDAAPAPFMAVAAAGVALAAGAAVWTIVRAG